MSRRAPRPKRNHWCFTSYLPVLPKLFDVKVVRYICYQKETCPETKRQHFQGYIELFEATRLSGLKKIVGECHAEPRLGTRSEAKVYCQKQVTAVVGSFVEFGVWREDVNKKRKLVDILASCSTLDELIETDPISYVRYHRGLTKLYAWRQRKQAKLFRKLEVICLIGDTGSGKTRKALEYPDHYVVPLGDHIWFDGYSGESTIILDDFYGGIKYGTFLKLCGGQEQQLPVKGSFVWALWKRVVITSNVGPEHWYKKGYTPAMRRRITKVIHMVNPDAPARQPSYMSFV